MTTRGRRDSSHDASGVVARWAAARNIAGAGGGSGSRDASAGVGSKRECARKRGRTGDTGRERENRTKEVEADDAEGSY
jgi:hypothetical protein